MMVVPVLEASTIDWTFYGGAGYRLDSWPKSKNSLFVGGVALYRVSEKFSFGAEAVGESATSTNEDHSSSFNVVGISGINDHYHVLFSEGRALNNVAATNRLSEYIALRQPY